jgi:hypothetical protein
MHAPHITHQEHTTHHAHTTHIPSTHHAHTTHIPPTHHVHTTPHAHTSHHTHALHTPTHHTHNSCTTHITHVSHTHAHTHTAHTHSNTVKGKQAHPSLNNTWSGATWLWGETSCYAKHPDPWALTPANKALLGRTGLSQIPFMGITISKSHCLGSRSTCWLQT